MTAPTIDEQIKYSEYRRKQIAELADWCLGFDMTGVSVSDADKQAGSPKIGDKIARNPKNHSDRWLVAADYFADNFEPATLQSIKSAGDDVVEPEYLIRLRNALKGFKSDGAFAGDKDIVDYIDSLQSALQVAQQDRDNCYASLDNVRRRLHEIETFVTGDANEYRINKKLKDDEKSIKSLIEHLLAMADNYHTVNQLYIQAKDRAEQAEAERDEFRKDAERYRYLRDRTSGDRYPSGVARFRLPDVKAHEGIFKGSVAQHLDAAIDAAAGKVEE